jgi:hypothetical protein
LSHLPALFAFVIFEIGSPGFCLALGSPTYDSWVAGIIVVHHHSQLFFVEMGSRLLFCLGLASNHNLPTTF